MIPMMIIMMRNDFDQKVDDEVREGSRDPIKGGPHFIICGQWLTMHARPDVANLAIF